VKDLPSLLAESTIFSTMAANSEVLERRGDSRRKRSRSSETLDATSIGRSREPLPYSLRCKDVPDSTRHRVLWWRSTSDPIPFEIEEGLIDVLVPYKQKERGMFRDQPKHRVQKLIRICRSKQISVRTALSLRRHHMKRYNPGLGMHQLRLGNDNDVRKSAELFELAVQEFLNREKVGFYSETEQKAYIEKHRPPGEPFPLTPDFILKSPIRIKQYTGPEGQVKNRRVVQERSVNCKLCKCV
jgi:hypothetical protein